MKDEESFMKVMMKVTYMYNQQQIYQGDRLRPRPLPRKPSKVYDHIHQFFTKR